MSAAKIFLDTNVVLYVLSGEAGKAETAEDLLAAGSTISVQVLNEVAAVALRKLGMSWPQIRQMLDVLRAVCEVEPLSLATHGRGMAIAERFGFSVYDSLIVAAALGAGCETLYSEDMQHGQVIEGRLTIRNPFRS
jgi:predicted nucleic acid-binding protein